MNNNNNINDDDEIIDDGENEESQENNISINSNSFNSKNSNSNNTLNNNVNNKKINLSKADIFSLGCVFAYTLSGGKHPFGESYLRENNIIKVYIFILPFAFSIFFYIYIENIYLLF